MHAAPSISVAVIVAHPDDETLWAGGTLLENPAWACFVACLCRGSDPDRRPKYERALESFGAEGAIGDLDDGPEQTPQGATVMKSAILNLLPTNRYDLIITHSPGGEYTRHRRHEEVGKAVIALWNERAVSTNQLWCFAYQDGFRTHYPRAIETDTEFVKLSPPIWEKKYKMVTELYGFSPESWEARTTPKNEAFWHFATAADAATWAARHFTH